MATFAVALAPLCYFFSAVRGAVVLSPDDAAIFNTPLRVAAANIVRAGFLPLWDPFIFSGMPLHGAGQAGLLFPLNWFYLVASPPVAANLMMLATYMLAAVGAYLFARRAGADIPGAMLTSLVWQSSAFLLEHIGHTNIVHTAAMLPWVLWAADGYAATGARRRGVLFAILIAVQAFAGHQQTLLYSLMVTGVYCLVIARTSDAPRKVSIQLLLVMVAGLALSAAQILPTFELLRNSLRATATYDFFASFSMPPGFVSTLLAPYGRGGGNGILFRAPYTGPQFFGEYSAYVGLLTLMLAVLALILKRDIRTRFWAIVSVVALFLAFGRFEPFQFYQLFYHLPVLNLFRCPGRHLMEVEFALAVLAGRGLTAMRSSRRSVVGAALIAGGAISLLTYLAVTSWRPTAFQLDRLAPVTLLRAPELFMPVLIVTLSAIVLFIFARARSRRALIALFAVLVLDLAIYSQGSGWVTHALSRDNVLWHEPETVKLLRETNPSGAGNFRILTQDVNFDPEVPVKPHAPDSGETFLLQPDIYMMHGIENAAGYDGFGLDRYSRFAGDMKVWGELTDAERTLRSDSRELDLLNVRYLLTRTAGANTAATTFLAPTQSYGNQKFAETDLGLAPLTTGQALSFKVPPTESDHVALVTNLAWSNEVPDHVPVARVQLRASNGKTFDFDLRAGDHSSEWAHDRPDLRGQIKHQRAPVATSYTVDDTHGPYEAHTYVCAFNLPAKAVIASGSITVLAVSNAPQLSLNVARISLANGEQAFPLRRDWLTIGAAPGANNLAQNISATKRWKKIAESKDVAIFENNLVLPRAWLANEARVLPEAEMLQVIRSGKFPDGQVWDPRSVALVESPLDFKPQSLDPEAAASVVRHEPNRVAVRTRSNTAAILVLSENNYPGWRAYVDGHFVETMRVDFNLRGVELPAGEHTVEFLYRPKSVFLGVAISLLTLIGLVVWCRLGRKRPAFSG